MSTKEVHKAFEPLKGLPCWNVKPGYGSFLTLEFGEPELHIREPIDAPKCRPKVRKLLARRSVVVHGQWHLWIYCCEWEVVTNRKVVGHSDLEGSTKKWIQRAADELNGQKLTGFRINPKRGSSTFEFDMGSRLNTKPYNKRSDQWLLYEPDGRVLTYLADGHYSRDPGDRPLHKKVWRAMR